MTEISSFLLEVSELDECTEYSICIRGFQIMPGVLRVRIRYPHNSGQVLNGCKFEEHRILIRDLVRAAVLFASLFVKARILSRSDHRARDFKPAG
jgi:hypothetical protein